MDKQGAIDIAMEFIKKWERLGWKTPSGGDYSPSQADSLSIDTLVYAYPDGRGYSIGWGTYSYLPSDNTQVTSNLSINKGRADDEFRIEVYDKVVPVLDQLITVPLNEYQYAALISFGYNAGPYALKYNNLLDTINNGGDVTTILKKTALTDSKTGQVSQGLVNRRKDEASLYSGQQNALYSYYLRNSPTIDYAILGILIISVTSYIYLKKKKN